jgi:hypothetical protein
MRVLRIAVLPPSMAVGHRPEGPAKSRAAAQAFEVGPPQPATPHGQSEAGATATANVRPRRASR